MSDFLPPRKFTAPEFVLGSGSHTLLAAYLSNFGSRRIFLASDAGLAAIGLPQRIQKALEGAGLEVVLFLDIHPNPRDIDVRRGHALYLEKSCDSLVALGGGSVIDATKGIGLMASNNRDILSFEGIDEIPLPGPPLVCIPTTAGTAADISQFAIINDTSRKTKIAIVSKKTIPDISLIDPELTVTMDPFLTAATGMDALTHAIEAYVSRAASPLCDIHALKAIELAGQYLVPAVRDGKNREARNALCTASLFAGLAFSNAGLGAVHALAHPLGGQLDLPHGLCNALLLSTVCAWNFEAARKRYREVLAALARGMQYLDDPIASKLCHRCLEYSSSGKAWNDDAGEWPGPLELTELIAGLQGFLPLPSGLAAAGLDREQIPSLARKAWLDACLASNPRKPQLNDLEELYARAL